MKTNLDYFWKKKTILSFFAIILVVIIHTSTIASYPPSEEPLAHFIVFLHNFFAYGLGAIAVPFFFFISGFTFFRNFTIKDYPRKLRSRTKTLLIPYLIWNTIGLLVIILCTYTPLSNSISSRELFEPSVKNILEGIFLYKYNFQFWFLFDLIIYTLLTPLFYLLIKNKFVSIVSGVLILCLVLINNPLPYLNFYFTIFYFLGCFFGKHHLSVFTKPASQKTAILSFLIFFISLFIRTLTIYNVINISTLASQLILIILLLGAWFSSDLFLKKSKKRKAYNEFFPIYALHTYFLTVFIKLIYTYLPKTPIFMLLNELLSPTFAVLIVIGLALIWHKKLPKLYKFAFGSSRS